MSDQRTKTFLAGIVDLITGAIASRAVLETWNQMVVMNWMPTLRETA